MAITTYNELKTAVYNWLHRDNISTYIDDIIMTGEKWIFRNARTRDMEEELNVAITSGLAAIPADYVALKHAYIDGTPTSQLEFTSTPVVFAKYPNRSDSTKPKLFSVDGDNFIFGPWGGSSYTMKGTYYKRLTVVSSSANALFTNNPDLYLFAALAESQSFLVGQEKRILLWTQKRNEILAMVNGDNQAGRSADAMRMMLA